MTTTKTPTTRDLYRKAFMKADTALRHVDVLMSDHSSRHEIEGMPVEQVLAMQDVQRLIEAAVQRLRRELPA